MQKCVEDLRIAIVKQAIADFQQLYCWKKSHNNILVGKDKKRWEELEEFFKSDWCKLLCGDIDIESILLKAKIDCQLNNYNYKDLKKYYRVS